MPSTLVSHADVFLVRQGTRGEASRTYLRDPMSTCIRILFQRRISKGFRKRSPKTETAFVYTDADWSGGLHIRWCETAYSACPILRGMLSYLRFRVDGRKRFKHATCGHNFSENREKTLRFFKYLDTCRWGLSNLKFTAVCSHRNPDSTPLVFA